MLKLKKSVNFFSSTRIKCVFYYMISERTYNMYRSPTIRMGYSTRSQCIGQSAWVGDTNAYRILVGIPVQKQSNKKDRRALWRWVESDSRSNEIADQTVSCFVRKTLNLLHWQRCLLHETFLLMSYSWVGSGIWTLQCNVTVAEECEYLCVPQNEKTRGDIYSLCLSKDMDKLRKLLLSRLKFGTAGLRGQMGPGYSQMNDLVIIQTAQGLVVYLEETLRDVTHNNGVVIGYDGRHNSRRCV